MDSSLQKPQQPSRWTLSIIILSLLGVVAMPVIAAYWPIERARWLLAAADNALEQSEEDGDLWSQKARGLLEQAASSYPAIENTLEFARTSFRMHPDELERALKLVRKTQPRNQVRTANALAESRLQIQDFDSAYAILVAGYPAPAARTAEERNQIAYYAALADRELESALTEINTALNDSKNASFLDTKAWILFRLQRFEEALVSIDQAIAELDRELEQIPLPSALKAKIEDLKQGVEPFRERPLDDHSDPLESLNRDFAQFIKSIVVLHYHRGEILEGLGRVDEADREYDWVQARGFHDFDRLY